MGLYNKTSLELLCRQIERDNPALAGTLDANTIMVLGGPYTANPTVSGRNARIILNGRLGNGFAGKKEFFYDRLNIGQMFKGITVVFQASGSSKTYADLLPALNAQYGLGLTASDLSNGTTKLPYGYTANQLTLNIATTSLAYTGALPVTWSRQPVGEFPESGPGTKVMLIGDMNEGYFGIVSEAELFSPQAMLDGINKDSTTVKGSLNGVPANRFWYKFARDGKILYLANYNHINIVWQDLYARGAAYEVDVPANKQHPQDKVIVRQRLAMKKEENGRDWFLSPCMPKLSGNDTWDYAAINQAPDPTGDVARLFAKIVSAGGYATGEWDGQTIDGSGFWFSTVSANNPAMAFGSSMVGLNQGMYNTATFTGGWRPVLELVNADDVAIPLENVYGSPTGVLRKPLFSIDPDTGDVLLNVSDVEWAIQGNLRRPLVGMSTAPLLGITKIAWENPIGVSPVRYGVATDPLLSVGRVQWQKLLRTPLVSLTSDYVEVSKVDLVTTNGELNGFN